MEENAIGMPDSFFERLNKKNGFADDTTAAPVDSGTTPVATDKTIPSGMPDSFFEKLNSQQHYADTNNWAENYKRYIPQAEENPSAWDNIKNNFFAIKDASEASMYGGLELMSRQGEKSGNANFANFIKAAGMYYGADPNWLVKNMQENEAQSQEELKRVWLDPKMGQFNATDMFADPKSFFQTQLPQMLGGSATLMAAGMGIAKGVQTGVMALGAAGAPFTFGGSAVAAGFIGGAVASAISRPIESLMEGYGAFDEAYSELAKKYPNATHQQLTDMAMPVFNKTFDENMQLQVLDAVQLGLSIIPVTAWGKGALSGTGAIGRMARRADMMRQRYNVAAHIGETAFQMGTEGWEEGRQMQITNEAINKYVGTDKPTSWYDMLNTKEGQSAVSGGAFMGGMMESPGILKLAYNKLTGVGDDIKTKPYEDIKQKQTALFYGNIAKSVNEGTTNEMMQAINKFGRSGVLATVETDDADSRNKSSIAEAKRLGDEVAEQVGVFSRMKEQYPDVSEKGLVRMFQNNALIRNNANALKTLSEDNVTDAPIIQRINAQNEALNKENNDIIAGKDVWETPSHEDPFADPEKDKEADIPFDSVEEVEAARLKEIEALQQIPTDGMTDEQMHQRAESLAEINSRYEDLKNRLTEKINDAKGHYENQRVLTEMLQNNIPVEGTIQKAYGMHYDFVTQDGKTVRFYNQATHDVVDDNDFNGSAFLVLRKAEQGLDGTYKDEKGNYLFRSVLGDKDHAERIEVHTTDKDGNDKYLGNVAVSNAEDYNIARDRAKAARMEKLEGEDGEGEGFSVSDEQLSGVKTTSNEQAAEAQSYGFRNAYHALNSVNKYFDADYTDYANIPKEDLALVGRIKQEEAASATTTTPPTPPPAPRSPSPATAPSGTTSSTDSGNAGYERTERSFDKVNVGDNITHNGKQGKVFAKVRPKGSLSHPVVLAKDAEGKVFRVTESEYKGTKEGDGDNVLKTNGKLVSYRNDVGKIVVDEENNVIFEGNKSSVELGKTTDEEFAAKSIGDIGISYVNENSLNQAILVDNTVYVKGEQQELVRINYDKNGNVVSYTYKNSKGHERTNRNSETALDIAIQKNNQEFDKSRKGASDEVKQRDEEHISGVVKAEYGDSIGDILETMPDEVYDTFDLMEAGVTRIEKDAVQDMVLRTLDALDNVKKKIADSGATKKEKGNALSMIEKFEKDLNKYYGKLDKQSKVSAKDVAKANTGENNKGVNTVQTAEQKTEAKIESTAKALEDKIPFEKRRQEAINLLPTETINYKDIKGIGDLSIYLNNPEALKNSNLKSAYQIYEQLKKGEFLKDKPYLTDKNELLDGQNRIAAQLALGNENVDVVKVGKDFFEKSETKQLSEAYHKAKADGSNPELVKAVEDLLAPKVAPTTNTEGETQTTEAQLQEFGVPEQDIKPVTNVLTAMVDGLRKAGLTAAKTVGEWLQIGKGEEKPYTLKINGEEKTVKPVNAEVVNGFYSPLEKVITESKQDKMPAKQWQDKFAKGEEAKWTGLSDWLNQQQGSVSKTDIQQFLKDNRIQVVEVVNSGKSEKYYQLVEEQKNASRELDILESDLDNWSDENYKESRDKKYELNDKIKELSNQIKEEESKTKDTKFENYQLEGEKENYKEVLVTMPFRKELNKSEQKELDELYSINSADRLPKQNARIMELIDKVQETPSKAFVSSHFDEPNILVHLRMNTRTDAEGKKVLFLEEVQSDWGQKGKKEGFRTDELPLKKSDLSAKKVDEVDGTTYWDIYKDNLVVARRVHGGESQISQQVIDMFWKVEETSRLKPSTAGQPSAPFVTDTNAWTKLGLKVALKEAVKQGADKIAWTTGEQQNDRYDLSKQVDWINAEKTKKGDYKIEVGHKDGRPMETLYLKETELEANLGKELATKIVNDGGGMYKGLDLQVGGSGMKGFYGSPTENKLGIVGNVAKKLFGQEPKTIDVFQSDKLASGWSVTTKDINGNVQTNMFDSKSKGLAWLSKQEELEVLSEDAEGKNYTTQHSITITPEMRAEVEGKGQPLFKEAEAQYRIESGKNIIEAIKDFNKSKNKARATVALTHEIMHPTVETIITGAKEGNAVGQKHTKTIVEEYNKANPDNKVTEEELIADNDKFVNGETTDKYRAVQEFIAEQWERYHQEGAKGFSKSFQEVLDAISEAFRSVYKSLTGEQLTTELRKMFDDILGKEELSTDETTPTKEVSTSENKIKSWIDKWEELKKENDNEQLDLFYNKVKVALNGYAQGKGVVDEFTKLKSEIEQFAKERKAKPKEQGNKERVSSNSNEDVNLERQIEKVKNKYIKEGFELRYQRPDYVELFKNTDESREVGQYETKKIGESVHLYFNDSGSVEVEIADYNINGGGLSAQAAKKPFYDMGEYKKINTPIFSGEQQTNERTTTEVNPKAGVSSNSNEGNSALRAVESTAKALEGLKEFKAESDRYFEYVPIEEIEKYKEFDRATEKKWGSADNTLKELVADIQKNGIKTPITLQVDINNNALVVEGNTRLAAAKKLGIKNIPVRIISGEFGSINKDKTKKLGRKRDIGEMSVFYPYVNILNQKNSPAKFGFTSITNTKNISEAYHKAKKDGSNPELVAAVEELLGAKEGKSATEPTKQASVTAPDVSEALKDVESTAKSFEGKEYRKLKSIMNIPIEGDTVSEVFTMANGKVLDIGKGWDIVRKGGGELIDIPKDTKERALRNNITNKTAIEQSNPNMYGLAIKGINQDGTTYIELIDGNNRLTKAEQLGMPFKVFLINDNELELNKKEYDKRVRDFQKKPREKSYSEAYHKAKADGSNPELVKAVEELLGKPKETSPTPNSKGEGTEVKYQIEESRDEPLSSVNPALAEYIRQRMQRLFPSVALFSDKASFEAAAKKVSKGVTFSSAYIGAAIKNMVYVDAEKALQHTEIHEYAHIYWDALPADHPLKVSLLEKFGGNEEATIDAIGRAGTIIMENELDIAKSGFFEKWLKKFWAAVKGVFTSKSIEQAFAERLLTNADEVTEENITSGVVKYMKMKSSAKYSELSEKAVKGIEKIIGKKISSLTFPEYYKHISTEIKPNDFKQWKMLSPQKFLEKMYGIVSPVSTLSPSNKAVFMKQYREYLDDYNWAENNVWTRFASGSMTLTVKEIEDLYMEAYKRKSYGTKDAVNFLADLYSKAVMYKNMQQEIKGDTFNKPFAKMSFDMMSGHEITDLSGSEFVSGKYSLLSPDRVKETILQGREKLYREVQRNATIKEDALKNDFNVIWKKVKDLKSDLRKIVDKTGTYFIDRNSSAYKALRGGTAADRALADLLDMHYKYESAYGGLSMEKGKYRVPVARMDFGGLAKKFGFKEGMRRYFAKPSKYDNVIIDVRSLGLSKPLMTLKQARQEMVKGSNAIYPFQMLKLTKKVDALTKEAYKQFNSGRHANGGIVTTEDLSGSRYGVSFVKDDESSEDLKVSMMLYHYANIENESYDLLSPYSMYIQKYLGRKDKPNMLKWVKMLDDDLIKGESPTSNLGVYAKYVQALTNYTHWLQLGFNIAGMPFNAFAGFAQSVREIGFRNTLRGLRRVIGSLTVGGGAGVVNAKAISIMEKLHIVSLSKDLEMSVTSKVGKHISKMAFLPVSFVEYINHAYSFIGAMDDAEWERVKALPANASAEDYTKAMGGNERIDELHTLTQKINGAYSKYSRRGINKTAEGRALMQFKNWLPDVIFAHLTVSQLNEAGEDLYGEYQSGIATSVKNTVWNKTIIPMFKDKSIAQAKKNWETLSEHERMQVGKAMRQLVILGGMALWIASLDDRDDKELKRMLKRAMGDVTYIFDVSNMQFLFDNTVPVFGTIKNLLGLVAEVFSTATGNPSVYEKRQGSHMRGDLKLPVMIENQTPVVNKISKLVNEGD